MILVSFLLILYVLGNLENALLYSFEFNGIIIDEDEFWYCEKYIKNTLNQLLVMRFRAPWKSPIREDHISRKTCPQALILSNLNSWDSRLSNEV